jgi:hypothetical protein
VRHQSTINVSMSAGVFLASVDSDFEAFFPSHFLHASQIMQLLAVDGTTQVVEAPVGHTTGDPLFFLLVEPENFEQLPRHFNIRQFLLSSNVTDVSFLTLLHDDIKGTTVIFDDVLAKLKLVTLTFPGHEHRVMMAVCSFHQIDRVCAEIAKTQKHWASQLKTGRHWAQQNVSSTETVSGSTKNPTTLESRTEVAPFHTTLGQRMGTQC